MVAAHKDFASTGKYREELLSREKKFRVNHDVKKE
jgi:hypothetical protein